MIVDASDSCNRVTFNLEGTTMPRTWDIKGGENFCHSWFSVDRKLQNLIFYFSYSVPMLPPSSRLK